MARPRKSTDILVRNLPGRPRKPVDLIELIGRRWAGESFPVIARRMHLGYGTVVRAHRTATMALQAVQNAQTVDSSAPQGELIIRRN